MARILLMDPLISRRQRILKDLSARNHSASIATSLAQLTSEIRVGRPDLLILGSDQGHPSVSDVILTVRSLPAGLETGVIAIQPDAKTPQSCGLLRLGADKVVSGQISAGALASQISQLMQKKAVRTAEAHDLPWAMAEDGQSFAPKL